MAKDEKKPIDDIAKPGSTVPNASAKPVIVSHKPMIKDPMVSEEDNDTTDKNENPTKDSEQPRSSKKSKVITPLSDEDSEKVMNEEKSDSEKQPEQAAEEEVGDEDSSAVVDEVVSRAGDKNIKIKEIEAEAKRREEINKTIESKKYFVKVKPPKAKRNKRVVFAVLIVAVFGLFGLLAAADAELISTKVPFDFIKVTNTVETATPEPVAQPVEETPKESNIVSYTDTAKVYSLSYPKDWTLKEIEWEDCCEGESTPEPNWANTPKDVQIVPNDATHKDIVVHVTATKGSAPTLDTLWNERTIDEFNSYEKVQINGYEAIYHITDFVGPGEVEAYLDHEYIIKNVDNLVTLKFRERYRHDTNENESGETTNFDGKKYLEQYEEIVNSVNML